MLSPTAVNQQKFRFDMENDLKTVTADAGHSLVGYTKVDLGIAKCHFELAVEQYGRMNDKVVEYKLVSIA